MSPLQDDLQQALGTAYTLQRELGGGGMSRVFLATESALGRTVVLKVLPPELVQAVSNDRFRQEIRLAARLQHAHIVALLSAGEAEGLLYYTMPFVEGESLRARLTRSGELSLKDAVRVLRDVAAALEYAHEQNVVHRDIKPDNVLLARGEALVTDFGVAKALSASTTEAGSGLTSLGVALGTPAYMSPEQASADPHVDHRADLYAWGCLAYETLTGQPPFTGRPTPAILAAHVIEAPEPLERRRRGIPPVLATLVMRCLAKRPADRPQSATELLHGLELAITPSGGVAPTVATPPIPADAWNARTPRKLLLAGGLTTLVLAGGLALGVRERGQQGRPADAPGQPAADSTLARSIAVLPFVNLSADRETDYFSDGMTEELISALGKVEGLRVTARTSVFAFKGKPLNLKDVGAQLQVGSVLEGSIRRAGDRLRVTAQLVSVRDGFQIWGESYDRRLEDVFAVQDDIARAIVGALRLKLTGQDSATLVRPSTGDLGALDLYLQGRFYWAKRGHENLNRAVEYFEAAIAKDPRFARAYVGLADALVLLPEYADLPGGPFYARVDTVARRALALDSTLAEAHATLGYRALQLGQWKDGEREFRRALAMDPSYATGRKWYGNFLQGRGDLDGADREFAIARRLDPLSQIVKVNQATVAYTRRRYDRALVLLQETLAVDSTSGLARQWVGQVQLANGMPKDAVRTLELLQAHDVDRASLALLAYAYARAGNSARAHEVYRELLKLPSEGYLDLRPYYYAAAGLGLRDSAIGWIAREATRIPLTPNSLHDPLLDPIRGDARFVELERGAVARANEGLP